MELTGAAAAAENAGGPRTPATVRPRVQGKFLFVGDEKFYVKGVTYGAFWPRDDGGYHAPEVIERDFAQMAANGINTVRIPHTTPPRSLLDAAQRHGLRVMVGLSAEQYVGYLIDGKKSVGEIERLVAAQVRTCAGHPALLCYALGNEIPAPLVRFLGHRRVERYLHRLYRAVKAEDPDGIVTYANYPTTEYLRLPWLDAVCFNVYLESQPALAAYLARLQNLADDRPLLMGELGLDSLRNGEAAQADMLAWQLRTAFTAGCAGAVVFSWTDEWFRSAPVTDWSFGLTDRERRPKPALRAVRDTFVSAPFCNSGKKRWPHISVIVCTHNGRTTIRDCLTGLQRLDYPHVEVIVVDDGSTDDTAAIASGFGFRIIATPHAGLSVARNAGLEAASGEIVAFLDDDAWPDPHWLKYLVLTFRNEGCAGAGGPNIQPPGDGVVADSVANAPGGPIHVMLSDTQAEHLPGCNMAFRRDALRAIGGFDPRFRTAGDDVDICWQLQAAGLSLVFSPAAVVWHHARKTVAAYWKQQRGYGQAEALLETKWPDKYNFAGHPTWAGRVYGRGVPQTLGIGARIYRGIRGSAPFQYIYAPTTGALGALPTMPEWYLLMAGLAVLSIGAVFWRPLLIAMPLLFLAVSFSLGHAVLNAARASYGLPAHLPRELFRRRCLTASLHILQPIARLSGRLRAAFHAWRRPGFRAPSCVLFRVSSVICTDGQEADRTLGSFETMLREELSFVQSGGSYAAWDLEARGGLFGGARILTAVEYLSGGQQLVRVRSWPVFRPHAVLLSGVLAALALFAAWARACSPSAVFAAFALIVAGMACWEAGAVSAFIARALDRLPSSR